MRRILMQNRPILVDTDPGIDDAAALFVLWRHRRVETKGILASYGNVPLSMTEANARRIKKLFEWNIPVWAGACGPLSGKAGKSADYIHGQDGLAGLSKILTCAPETPLHDVQDGIEAVYRKICELGTVDYISLGPLTNLAELTRRHSDAWTHIGRVITMGGGIDMGNVTKDAEFNIHCDAEAAAEVFANAPELWIAPLNITASVAFTMDEIKKITSGGGELHTVFRKLLETNYRNCIEYGESGATMHDSVAVLLYLFPELFDTVRCGIDVDCSAEHYGKTTLTSVRQNILLPTKADSRVLLTRIAECL